MPAEFSIKISDFIGIFRAIAEKSNVNGGNTLEGEEISIFYKTKKTIDYENNVFTFNNKLYDEHGQEVSKNSLNGSILKAKNKSNVNVSLAQQGRNDAAIKSIESYVKVNKVNHKEFVNMMANKWADKFPMAKSEGMPAFKAFIERLYLVADELNITKLNEETLNEINGVKNKKVNFDRSQYTSKKDQIVDEMLAAFANESKLSNKATNGKDAKGNPVYYGIFQMSEVAMKEIDEKKKLINLDIPHKSMSQFLNLSKTEQLKYMVAHEKVAQKFYSKNSGESISASQMWAMWKYPSAGKVGNIIKTKKRTIHANDTIKSKIQNIEKTLKYRGNIME